jgi:hypothetical protein
MKRMVILLALVTLLGAVALQPGAVAGAERGKSGLVPGYAVQPGSSSGGHYGLASLGWQVCGRASGVGYRLLAPAAAAQRGSGCCCTYLPIVLRHW